MNTVCLETKNLVMVQVTEDDFDLFHNLSTDEEVIKYCFDKPSLEEVKQRFESRLPKWRKDSEHWLCLSILDKRVNQKVGVTGFVLNEDGAEVGFLLSPEFKGRNIATESLREVLRWARDVHDIQNFNAVVTEGNVASERVLQKCGFNLEQRIADAYEIRGKLYADLIYKS